MAGKRASIKAAPAVRYTDDEKIVALETVIICQGNVSEASRQLGIPRRTIQEWADGVNVSEDIHADYADSMRARVARRVEALHASADEVLSLYALHLRGDIADFDGLIDQEGNLDLQGARKKGISRLVKKVRTVPTKNGVIREIEFYSSQAAADSLAKIHGLNTKPAENPDTVEKRRGFWRAQLEDVMVRKDCEENEARDWLLMNVPAAQAEKQYLM